MATDLATQVRARVPFDEAPAAIAGYAAQMAGGKVLLVPRLAA